MICESCKHYEEDYMEQQYFDEIRTIKGEWCHKTGKPIRFNSSEINYCEDFEKEDDINGF